MPYFEAVLRSAPERVVNLEAFMRLLRDQFPDQFQGQSKWALRKLVENYLTDQISQRLDQMIVQAQTHLRPIAYTLILPDVHRPFHNKILWEKVLKLIQFMGPQLKRIILPGDFLDLYMLGSYNADSLGLLREVALIDGQKIQDLQDEYVDGRKGILELESVLPAGCEKIYIYGNHEDRYFREINKGDKSKYGAALKSPTEALGLKEGGWQVFHNWMEDSFEINPNLEVIHGIFCNIHTASKHVQEFDNSIIFGHTHRFQSWGSTGGKVGYNIGWLGDAHHKVFRYMYKKARQKKWQNGFAVVAEDEQGHWFVEPVACRSNSFLWAGKIW